MNQILLTIAFFLLFSTTIFAQKTEKAPPQYSTNIAPTARIQLKTGEKLSAKILSKDSSQIKVLILQTDELRTIYISDLAFIQPMKSRKRSDKIYDMATRNGISSTAIGLKSGEGYYQNTMLGYNSGYFGLSNNFSLGVGTELFEISEFNIIPVWLHPKFSYAFSENIHASANGFIMNTFELRILSQTEFLFAAWLNLTIGNRNSNVTVGFGKFGDEFSGYFKNNMFQMSGQVRLSKRFSLVGDFYLLQPKKQDNPLFTGTLDDNSSKLLNATLRFQYRRSTFELGVLHTPGGSNFIFEDITVPTLTYALRW